jgi:hypothetical protein
VLVPANPPGMYCHPNRRMREQELMMEISNASGIARKLRISPSPPLTYHGRAATLRRDGTPSPLMRPVREGTTGNPKD